MSGDGAGPALTVVVPMHPPPEAAANWRGHHLAKYRAQRDYRTAARYIARSSVFDLWGDDRAPLVALSLRVTIRWGTGRKRQDPTNAVILVKAAIDGIADALGVDDRLWRITDLVQERDPTGAGETVVELWQAGCVA